MSVSRDAEVLENRDYIRVSREIEPTECVCVYKEKLIYLKTLVHVIVQAWQVQNLMAEESR